MTRTVYRRTPGPLPDLPPTATRPVVPADDAALADLVERAYAGTADEHLGGNNDGAVEIASWRPAAVPHASFVIAADGLLAASLISQSEGELWLAYVITHPDHQNRGLGTAVVAASLAALNAHVFAGLTDGNTPGEKLLARFGFSAVRR
jgi:GNAT superfamily N-acetyltransferase